MAVPLGQPGDQRGHVFGQGMLVLRRVSDEYPGHAGDTRRRFGGAGALGADHQHMEVAIQLGGGADGGEGSRLDGTRGGFGNDEDAHIRSPALHS